MAVDDHAGNHVANAPRATRKDVRDAVRAARGALPGWQGRTAYNRGQILYRFAEALESRVDELAAETTRLRGCGRAGGDRGGGRPRGALRGLDRQAARGAGRGQPGRGAALQLHDPGADRRGRRDRARRAGRARPGGRDPAAAGRRQRGGGGGVRALAAAPAPPRRGARRGRCARGRREPAVRPAQRAGEAARRPPRRRRDRRPHGRSRGDAAGGRQRHARVARLGAATTTSRGSTGCRGSSRSSSSRPPGTRSAPEPGPRGSRVRDPRGGPCQSSSPQSNRVTPAAMRMPPSTCRSRSGSSQ